MSFGAKLAETGATLADNLQNMLESQGMIVTSIDAVYASVQKYSVPPRAKAT